MAGFYSSRSKSYNFNSDFLDFVATKSVAINGEIYFSGYEYVPLIKNQLFTIDQNGKRKVGPKIDGPLKGIISDGYGGFFIYGNFRYVNEKYRRGIAHFNSSGYLTEWNAGLNGSISCAVRNNTNVYVGGDFSNAKGVTRNRLAAFSLSGQLLTWNANCDNSVESMEMNNNVIYIGGNFSLVNGLTRNRLAAINTSGSLLSWNPSASSTVWSIKYFGPTDAIYISGDFTSIFSNTRSRLASISTVESNATGNVLSWNPSASGRVAGMDIFGSNIYIGGDFTSVNGNTRNSLAAIDFNGNLLNWNPNVVGKTNYQRVEYLNRDGLNIYVSGAFNYVSSVKKDGFAVIGTDGNLKDFNVSTYDSQYPGTFLQKFGDNVYFYGDYFPYDRCFGIYKIDKSGEIQRLLNVNRSIYDMTSIGSNIYFGGDFDRVGGIWSTLAVFNTSGSDLTNLSIVDESSEFSWVTGVLPHGVNEYFVFGYFDSINGVKRKNIAKINSSGGVSDFNIDVNGGVTCAAAIGDNIYIGGEFNYINANSRNRLAAINSSGSLLSWNPDVGGIVETISISGSNIYFSGNFILVSGQSRNYLAAVNTSGSLLSWNPSASSTVSEIGILGNDIYVAGSFTSVNGNVRNRLAAINTSGNVLAWNPSSSSTVRVLKILGNNVYIGGDFTSISGNVRNRLAAINTVNVNSSGNVLAWNPSADSQVYDLDIVGSNIYISGYFYNISSTERKLLAAVNTSGSLLSWNPFQGSDWEGAPESIKVIGTNVYCGWFYPELFGSNSRARFSIAAVNTSGTVLDWNPSTNSIVRGLVISGSNLYIGGAFTLINGNTRNRLAAINTTGNVLSWNPSASSNVLTMAIIGDNIYTAGLFTSINGNVRNYLAAVNTSGNVLNWNPIADNVVDGIKVDQNNIYVSGSFIGLGTNTSYRVITQAETESNTIATNGSVTAITSDVSGGIYIGGSFTSIDGVERNRLAYVNSSGFVTNWNPNVNGIVDAILISGTSVYIGGEFTSVFSNTRNRLAALSTVDTNATGNVLTWNPNANNTVYSMGIIGVNIYIGGAFTSVNNNVRNRLAAVNTTANVVDWNPNANANVYAVAVSGVNVYVGGAFTLVNGNARGRLAGINTVANVIAWAPSASSNVFAMSISGNNIYIGGAFTIVGGLTRNRLVGVNTSGTVFWTPSANGNIYAVAVSGANVYVGGDFSLIGGNTRNDLAALDATSAAILSWNPSSSAVICTIATSGNNVYIGASTTGTTATGQQSKFLAVINANGSMVNQPKVVLQKVPTSVAISGNNVYVGGGSFVLSLNTLIDTANYLYTTNEQGKVLKRYALTKGVTNSGPGIYDFAVDVSGGVYIGGEFGSVDGITANNIAYINSSGSVVSWGVGTNHVVHDIAILGDNVYIGGWFTAVNGVERQRLAAASSINVNATGNLLAWNPSASSNVYDIDIANNIIYVGGSFTSVNGNVRNRLAAINTSGGVLSWNPNASGLVADLKILGNNVYIGGEFLAISGLTRRYLAAINTVDINATGNVLAWNPSASNSSYSMAISGTNIYVGGAFFSVSSTPRNLAVVNTAGSLQPLNVQILFNTGTLPEYGTPQNIISCIDVDGSNIYAGGIGIQVADGQLRPGAFAVNTSGSLLSFSAIGNWISRIKKVGSTIFVAPTIYGFTPIYGGESTIPNFITLDKNNLLLKSINIETDAPINDIYVGNETLILNSRKQVFDIAPSYKITDERLLNTIEQGLE